MVWRRIEFSKFYSPFLYKDGSEREQMTKCFVGIDPGLHGGIAVLLPDGRIETYVIPTLIKKVGSRRKMVIDHVGLRDIFKKIKRGQLHAVVEMQHAMPGQGVSSMLTIGIGYGSLVQTLVDFEVSFEEVRAQVWQKDFGIGKGDTKAQALEVCQDLFPNLNLLATKRSRKAHSGIVDAVLIMQYGIRRHKNEI